MSAGDFSLMCRKLAYDELGGVANGIILSLFKLYPLPSTIYPCQARHLALFHSSLMSLRYRDYAKNSHANTQLNLGVPASKVYYEHFCET